MVAIRTGVSLVSTGRYHIPRRPPPHCTGGSVNFLLTLPR